MKVIEEGYTYEVSNFENPEEVQLIQFIHKVIIPEKESSGELMTLTDGTTNEELLEVLINRLQFLATRFPSRENAIAITKLEEALMWLNKRTANRKARGVEGKHLK